MMPVRHASTFGVLLLVSALLSAPAVGQIYVDKDATGAGDGTSWDDAHTSLQDALSDAQAGDQVWVDNDVYYPDNGSNVSDDDRAASFNLKDGVTVFGGFQGTESTLQGRPTMFSQATTTLSGDIDQTSSDPSKGDSDMSGNAYHVVTSDGNTSSAALRNVRIAHGNADGDHEQGLGGGVLFTNSDAQLINAYVQENKSKRGAGIGIKKGSPTLHGNLINANTASIAGGGVYEWNTEGITATHNTITKNDAPDTGGVFKVNGSSWETNGEQTSVTTNNENGDLADLTVSPTTVTFNELVVGDDVYPGGSYAASGRAPENGVLDSLLVGAGVSQASVDMTSGSNTAEVYLSRDADLKAEVIDDDFIPTWAMSGDAPDPSVANPDTFLHEPGYQSNASGEKNVVSVPNSDVKSSYDVAVIPSQTPLGRATSSYKENLPITYRWRHQTTDSGEDLPEIKFYISTTDGNGNDIRSSDLDRQETIAEEVFSNMSVPHTITRAPWDTIAARYNERDGKNIAYTRFDGSGPNNDQFFDGNNYIRYAKSNYGTGINDPTMLEEIAESMTDVREGEVPQFWTKATPTDGEELNADGTFIMQRVRGHLKNDILPDYE